MQEAWAGSGPGARLVRLPPSETVAVPGVAWGRPDSVNTPAYWAVRCRWDGDAVPSYSANGSTLVEEIGFCILGGFGVRFEVADAAFRRLRACGVFEPGDGTAEAEIRALLVEPLDVGGRSIRYRFPNQRSSRIARMRERIACLDLDRIPALALRDALMEFDGIGPKTASWIVRNHLDSDDVAILDVHVIRACRAMKVFDAAVKLPRDYAALETRFLALASAIGVRASVLDSVMWSEVRGWGLN